MKPLALLAALALLAPGCRSIGAIDGADIAVNLAIATSVAVARRAEGDCYVPCDFGTYCDTRTGTCEALPCHGQCKDDEICDTRGPVDRCIAGAPLQISQQAMAPPAAPAASPSPSALPPTTIDVPRAEPAPVSRPSSLEP